MTDEPGAQLLRRIRSTDPEVSDALRDLLLAQLIERFEALLWRVDVLEHLAGHERVDQVDAWLTASFIRDYGRARADDDDGPETDMKWKTPKAPRGGVQQTPALAISRNPFAERLTQWIETRPIDVQEAYARSLVEIWRKMPADHRATMAFSDVAVIMARCGKRTDFTPDDRALLRAQELPEDLQRIVESYIPDLLRAFVQVGQSRPGGDPSL